MLATLDSLVEQGRYTARTAAVRDALERLIEDERCAAVDRAIVDGCARKPPDAPDEVHRALAEWSIRQEPW